MAARNRVSLSGLVAALLLLLSAALSSSSAEATYKLCVPEVSHDACVALMQTPSGTSGGARIECVRARDRMDCLRVVRERGADFMIVDPEDMYVAYRMQNEDFAVFSEIRTLAEPRAEFRYEGIMLVRKGSAIHGLRDLAGKAACYTGYGRNVGFKIPLTKLSRAGVIKYSTEALPAPEKELKALSEFFSKGCLVGRYSPDLEINAQLKKKYANLCELCEDPAKCDYPDSFSGYEGAVRCVAQGRGDVAFSKVIFVHKYFGLAPNTTAQGDADDFEYLCEDGSRRPVRGAACSWAARPWQGYMSNGDLAARAAPLQAALPPLYDAAKAGDADAAEKRRLLVDAKNLVVNKDRHVLPGAHLELSRYLDVIERSTTRVNDVRLCVDSLPALDKCHVMKMAAFSRDIRPRLECHLKTRAECVAAVVAGQVDALVVRPSDVPAEQRKLLKCPLAETFAEEDKMVAFAPQGSDRALLQKARVQFDEQNRRAKDAALLYAHAKGEKVCEAALRSSAGAAVRIAHASQASEFPGTALVCQDFSQRPWAEFGGCNFDLAMPRAVCLRGDAEMAKRDDVVHAFTAISDQFGRAAAKEDVFRAFGEFRAGQQDVLFDDRAQKLADQENEIRDRSDLYLRLHCDE